MTIEEVARQAAEKLIHVARYHDTADRRSWKIWLGILDYSRDFYSEESVNDQADHLRKVLAEAVLAAIRQALVCPEPSSPVSEARLVEIAREAPESEVGPLLDSNQAGPGLRVAVYNLLAHRVALRVHVEHQARLIAWFLHDDGEAQRAMLADAFRRGAEAQRKAILQATRELPRTTAEGWLHIDETDAYRAIQNAPLATPGRGDDEG